MTRLPSLALGLLMVAAGAMRGDGPALVAATVAVAALVAGLLLRAAATLAVLATVAAVALAPPSPAAVAVAGLAAVGYLGLRHSEGRRTVVTVPTVVAALSFSAVAVLSAVVPPGLPWVPLAAPLVVVVIYAMVLQQYTS